MKKAINLYFYGGDTKYKLDKIKEAGYDAVLLSAYTIPETMTINEQLDYCKKIGLEVSMVHCKYNPGELDCFWDEKNEIADIVTNDYISQIESISGSDAQNFVIHLRKSPFSCKKILHKMVCCQMSNISTVPVLHNRY